MYIHFDFLFLLKLSSGLVFLPMVFVSMHKLNIHDFECISFQLQGSLYPDGKFQLIRPHCYFYFLITPPQIMNININTGHTERFVNHFSLIYLHNIFEKITFEINLPYLNRVCCLFGGSAILNSCLKSQGQFSSVI